MFNKCLATEVNLRRKASALRFALGAAVACRTVGGAWAAGTVKGQLVRDSETPQGESATYSVQLDDGSIIVVRSDCSSVITGAPSPEAAAAATSSSSSSTSSSTTTATTTTTPGDEESAKARDRSWYLP